MYEATIERLAAPGLEMYEISNFARPGHESRHNLVYWANDAYFGFGVGAARYIRRCSVGQYARPAGVPSARRSRRAGHRAAAKNLPPRPGARDRRPDAAPHQGRHRARRFQDADGLRSRCAARAIDRALATSGSLDDDGERVRLSREGLFVADLVSCVSLDLS